MIDIDDPVLAYERHDLLASLEDSRRDAIAAGDIFKLRQVEEAINTLYNHNDNE